MIGHVHIKNVGHLPARNMTWFIEVTLAADGDLNEFPIAEDRFRKPIVIFPGTEAARGSASITLKPEGFIYVWAKCDMTMALGDHVSLAIATGITAEYFDV